jgi:hypothetical protein
MHVESVTQRYIIGSQNSLPLQFRPVLNVLWHCASLATVGRFCPRGRCGLLVVARGVVGMVD